MALRGYPIGSSSSAETVPGARPDDLHHFLTDFLTEGVVKGFEDELEVTEHAAGANMSVDVAVGKALIEVTTETLDPNYTFKTWLTNSAVVVVPVATADATNPRIDRIVAKFDPSVDPNGAASNNVSIELIKGTPAGSPSAPAVPDNAISLATVAVAAGETAIETAHITDTRVYVQVAAAVFSELARDADVLHESLVAFTDWSEKTIASGAITVTGPLHTVDTEGDASSDDLDTVTAQVGSGELIILKAAHTDRTVVVKNATGNIKTADGLDFSIDTTEKSITLIRQGTTWYEVCRAIGAPSVTHYSKIVYLGSGVSTAVSGTDDGNFDTHTYTIPANDLVAGVAYRFRGHFFSGINTALTFSVKLGTTAIVARQITIGAVNQTGLIEGEIFGTAAAGASVAVNGCMTLAYGNGSSLRDFSGSLGEAAMPTANVATNGNLTLQFSVAKGASGTVTLMGVIIERLSTTPS